MKIKIFLIAVIAFFAMSFSSGNFSVIPNEVHAVTNSIEDDDYTYERVYHDGQWWIVVYDGGIPIAEYPDDD